MRFTTFLLAGVFAVANAQDSSSASSAMSSSASSMASTPASTETATTTVAPPPKTSQQKCLDACPSGDVTCQSHCIAVPAPNGSQVNATTECAAKCVQGNGTQAETERYAPCQQACIKQHYFDSSSGTPQPTGAAGGSGSGSDNSGSGASASGSNGASATGSDDSSASGSPTGTGSDSSSSPTGTSSGSSASASALAPALHAAPAALLGLVAAIVAL